jgi:APA family basic amino acid/polyamine antiporter
VVVHAPVTDSPPLAPDDLPRRLGLFATIAIVVGTVIGSGIFRVPGSVAARVGALNAVAVVWVVGGVISLCGALSLAELAAAMPRSGGVFVYLHEIYGDAVAFLFGWTMLIVGPASIGALAIVFAEYFSAFVPLSPVMVRVVASAVTLAVCTATFFSVRGVGGIVTAAAAGKAAALLMLVAAAFVLGNASAGTFSPAGGGDGPAHWGGVGFALVSALWAYNGFNDMVSVSGEVQNPGRVLPRALIWGMALVMTIYLSANAAYLYVLPFSELQQSPMVATDAMLRVIGPLGSRAVAAMVMLSTFGAIVGVALVNPRVFYAMATSGLLFKPLGRVHPRFHTPHVAIVAHTAIAVAALWWRSFEQLAAAFVLGIWPFLALATAGVLILRRTRPDLPRPYRTPGYPVIPLVFIAGTIWVVASAVVAQPMTTLMGIAVTLLGIPVYLLRRRPSA